MEDEGERMKDIGCWMLDNGYNPFFSARQTKYDGLQRIWRLSTVSDALGIGELNL